MLSQAQCQRLESLVYIVSTGFRELHILNDVPAAPVARICLNLHRKRGVCSILEILRLWKVIVLLGSIPVVLRPIIDCSILIDSLSDFGLSDLQSLLVRLWNVRSTGILVRF